jgi:hypothetical protein
LCGPCFTRRNLKRNFSHPFVGQQGTGDLYQISLTSEHKLAVAKPKQKIPEFLRKPRQSMGEKGTAKSSEKETNQSITLENMTILVFQLQEKLCQS